MAGVSVRARLHESIGLDLDGLRRQWPHLLRAAAEIVLGTWLVVVLPVLAVYISSSSMDAAAALSLGVATRAGTQLWSLGLGGSWPAGGLTGAVSLPALGLAAVDLWIVRSALRRARMRTWSGVALTGLAVMIGSALVVSLTGCGGRTWAACAVLPAATVVVGAWQLQRGGYGVASVEQAWQRRPEWLRLSLVISRDCLAVLTVGSLMVLTGAVIGGAGRVSQLHDALTGGAVIASLGVIALELAWAPTALVWAGSWLIGPGFAVGEGTSYAPDHVVSGGVPVLPALGLLPAGPVGGDTSRLGLYLPLLVTLAAIAIALTHRQRLMRQPLAHSLGAATAATGAVTAVVAVASLLASGAIGPGRLAQTGPNLAQTAGLVALEIGAGLLITAVAVHPTTHRATRTGARAAVGAVADAGRRAAQRTGTEDAAATGAAEASVAAQAAGRIAQAAAEAASQDAEASSQASQGDQEAQDTQGSDALPTTTPAAHAPAAPAPTGSEHTVQEDAMEAHEDPTRLVVLVSGTGSNLAALLKASQDPGYGARVVGVVADKECPGLDHARRAGVPDAVVSPRDYADRRAWDVALTREVAAMDPEMIVCAGFMRILGQPFLERFEGSVINTHPSLLPDFPGAHAVRDALAAGATRTGATLFWVDAGVDTGRHIAQVEVPVEAGDTEESLTARVKAAETPQLVEQVGILARGWHPSQPATES